jgi:hypothetical protein
MLSMTNWTTLQYKFTEAINVCLSARSDLDLAKSSRSKPLASAHNEQFLTPSPMDMMAQGLEKSNPVR